VSIGLSLNRNPELVQECITANSLKELNRKQKEFDNTPNNVLIAKTSDENSFIKLIKNGLKLNRKIYPCEPWIFRPLQSRTANTDNTGSKEVTPNSQTNISDPPVSIARESISFYLTANDNSYDSKIDKENEFIQLSDLYTQLRTIYIVVFIGDFNADYYRNNSHDKMLKHRLTLKTSFASTSLDIFKAKNEIMKLFNEKLLNGTQNSVSDDKLVKEFEEKYRDEIHNYKIDSVDLNEIRD
ncbi:unnamed protein product, partial [Brachionus calyciflorus]